MIYIYFQSKGRQIFSTIRPLLLSPVATAASLSSAAHFIRAPAIVRTLSSKVTVLAHVVDDNTCQVIAAVEQGHLLGVCFHSEVTNDLSWVHYFLQKVHAVALQRKKCIPSLQRLTNSQRPELPSTTAGLVTSVKRAFPRFLTGGVIMDVVNAEQASIAEAAGACAVMALERIPADIKADGGIARMSDPILINSVLATCSVPVMAKTRIGHFGEARILEALAVDCIDESEVLTVADTVHHILKTPFAIPFVCGAEDLGSALRRIAEGASMIRLKGNAGTGDVKNAVTHARKTFGEIRRLGSMEEDEICAYAKMIQAPLELVLETRRLGRLPVTTFAAGGIATPADVVLMVCFTHLICLQIVCAFV